MKTTQPRRRGRVNMAVYRTLAEVGIEIPSPQREIAVERPGSEPPDEPPT